MTHRDERLTIAAHHRSVAACYQRDADEGRGDPDVMRGLAARRIEAAEEAERDAANAEAVMEETGGVM